MIVADTNIIAGLVLVGPATSAILQLYKKDPVWVAPKLWREEMLNVLASHERKMWMTSQQSEKALGLVDKIDGPRPEGLGAILPASFVALRSFILINSLIAPR